MSASPEEVVAPIAQLLGVDEAIATRAELDDEGRYSGAPSATCYADEKVVAISEVAERDGLDLDHCWAYSDSATDIPMLAAVGHPVAVNPDRELAKAAKERGWQVEQFASRCRCATACRCRRRSRPRRSVGGRGRRARRRWGRGGCGGGRPARRPAVTARSDGADLLGGDGGEGDEDDEEQELLHAGRVAR